MEDSNKYYFINNKNGLITPNDVLIKKRELALDKTPTDYKPNRYYLETYNISHEKNIPINIERYDPGLINKIYHPDYNINRNSDQIYNPNNHIYNPNIINNDYNINRDSDQKYNSNYNETFTGADPPSPVIPTEPRNPFSCCYFPFL